MSKRNETRTRGRVRIVPMVLAFDGLRTTPVASVEGETNDKTGERRIRVNSEIGEARVYPVRDFVVGPDPDGKEKGRVYVELSDGYSGPADLWQRAEWPKEEEKPGDLDHVLTYDDPTKPPCFIRTVEAVAKYVRAGRLSKEDAKEVAETTERPCPVCMLFQLVNPETLKNAVEERVKK